MEENDTVFDPQTEKDLESLISSIGDIYVGRRSSKQIQEYAHTMAELVREGFHFKGVITIHKNPKAIEEFERRLSEYIQKKSESQIQPVIPSEGLTKQNEAAPPRAVTTPEADIGSSSNLEFSIQDPPEILDIIDSVLSIMVTETGGYNGAKSALKGYAELVDNYFTEKLKHPESLDDPFSSKKNPTRISLKKAHADFDFWFKELRTKIIASQKTRKRPYLVVEQVKPTSDEVVAMAQMLQILAYPSNDFRKDLEKTEKIITNLTQKTDSVLRKKSKLPFHPTIYLLYFLLQKKDFSQELTKNLANGVKTEADRLREDLKLKHLKNIIKIIYSHALGTTQVAFFIIKELIQNRPIKGIKKEKRDAEDWTLKRREISSLEKAQDTIRQIFDKHAKRFGGTAFEFIYKEHFKGIPTETPEDKDAHAKQYEDVPPIEKPSISIERLSSQSVEELFRILVAHKLTMELIEERWSSQGREIDPDKLEKRASRLLFKAFAKTRGKYTELLHIASELYKQDETFRDGVDKAVESANEDDKTMQAEPDRKTSYLHPDAMDLIRLLVLPSDVVGIAQGRRDNLLNQFLRKTYSSEKSGSSTSTRIISKRDLRKDWSLTRKEFRATESREATSKAYKIHERQKEVGLQATSKVFLRAFLDDLKI